jgi:hypothetical protein
LTFRLDCLKTTFKIAVSGLTVPPNGPMERQLFHKAA